jgi:hypothetical protein
MPTEPTVRNVHINRAVTNMSVAIMNDASEFIGYQVLPSLSVKNWSDNYFIYNAADFLRDDVQLRAPGGLYPEVGYGISTGSYQAKEYALATDVPDEVRDAADAPLDPDFDAATLLAQKFLLAHENRVINLVLSTSNVTQNKTLSGAGNFQWSDYANSDPVGDIWAARKTIRRATLKKPNSLAMGEQIWEDAFFNHPAFIERIKYTERATPESMRNAVGALFMVDNIYSSGAIQNTANKGATTVYADMWSDYALLYYKAPRPSLRQPSFGWTMEVNGGVAVRTKRDDLRDRDVHQGKHISAEKIITDTCGYLFVDTLG